jgi:hypothetical protein
MPLLQELTCCPVQTAVPGPPPSCHWPAVFKHMPHLHTLTLSGNPPDALLTALQGVPSLRCLTVPGDSYTLLAQLTQLQVLTLAKPLRPEHILDVVLERDLQPDASKPRVLSSLTGLTSLEIIDTSEPSHAWQAQLATALAAMHQLRRLALPRVWPGPVAQALSHMQQLTELDITDSSYPLNPLAALLLPGVEMLRARWVDLSFLDSLVAPRLQVLQGGLGSTKDGQPLLYTMVLDIQQLYPPFQQAAALERCMQGVMRHCNQLELCFPGQACAAGAHSKSGNLRAVVTSVVQILSRCWRPDPNLIDGRSPLNPLRLAGGRNAPVASVSGGWGLTLCHAVVNSSVAAALPQSLTYINLRCVTNAQLTACMQVPGTFYRYAAAFLRLSMEQITFEAGTWWQVWPWCLACLCARLPAEHQCACCAPSG